MKPPTQKPSQQASVAIGPTSGVAANAMLVRPGKPGGRFRHQGWRESEYVQLALQTLYPAARPTGVPRKVLLKQVNDWLANDPKYRAAGFGPVGKNTILRAMKLPLWS